MRAVKKSEDSVAVTAQTWGPSERKGAGSSRADTQGAGNGHVFTSYSISQFSNNP